MQTFCSDQSRYLSFGYTPKFLYQTASRSLLPFPRKTPCHEDRNLRANSRSDPMSLLAAWRQGIFVVTRNLGCDLPRYGGDLVKSSLMQLPGTVTKSVELPIINPDDGQDRQIFNKSYRKLPRRRQKNIKTEADLNEFRQMLIKITSETATTILKKYLAR